MKKTSLLLVFMCLLHASCSNEGDPTPVSANIVKFRGTQSPGDVWEWEMNYDANTMIASWDAGTFDDTSDDISVKGDFIELPSGFLKVTITEVTPQNPEIPDDGTAYFYALEVPGTALIVKPEGSIKGDVIAMVGQGDCNSVAGGYNYIMTSPGNSGDYNSLTGEAFGEVTMSSNGGDILISGTKSSLDCLGQNGCTVSGPISGIPAAQCTGNGAIEIVEGGITNAQGQFTPGGVMMLDMGKGNGGVFALKKSAIAIADFNSKKFNGIAYFPTQESKTLPVTLEFSANGNAAGYGYTNIETNNIDSQNGVLLQITNINNGLATGTIDHQDGVTNFAAAVLTSGTKKIMVLSSTTTEVGNPPFMLLLVSK